MGVSLPGGGDFEAGFEQDTASGKMLRLADDVGYGVAQYGDVGLLQGTEVAHDHRLLDRCKKRFDRGGFEKAGGSPMLYCGIAWTECRSELTCDCHQDNVGSAKVVLRVADNDGWPLFAVGLIVKGKRTRTISPKWKRCAPSEGIVGVVFGVAPDGLESGLGGMQERVRNFAVVVSCLKRLHELFDFR